MNYFVNICDPISDKIQESYPCESYMEASNFWHDIVDKKIGKYIVLWDAIKGINVMSFRPGVPNV